jgi:sugar/nucleoside kinase (ribokinase family)
MEPGVEPTVERGPVVLVVGAASRDITDEDPRGWRLGGAVTYCALTLARLGMDVRAVVAVDSTAADASELDELAAAGVAISLARLRSAPVLENVETPGGRRQRCIAASDPIELSAIPPGWTRGNDAVLLGPIAAELGAGWARFAAGTRHVALGWQGLLRDMTAGSDVRRVDPCASPLLDAASLVSVSRDDLAEGQDPRHLLALLRPDATLVVTHGEEGGRILSRGADGAVRDEPYPAISSDRIVDPTGAGDVFLASMLAARLDPALGSETHVAAAAASLVVEAPGLAGVPELAAIRRRLTRPPSLASRSPSADSSRASGRPSQA